MGDENPVSTKRSLHRKALRDNVKQQNVDEILVRTDRLDRVSDDSNAEDPSDEDGYEGGCESVSDSEKDQSEGDGDDGSVAEDVQGGNIAEENGENLTEGDRAAESDLGSDSISIDEGQSELSSNDDLANSVSSDSDGQAVNANVGEVVLRNEEDKQQYVIDNVREWTLEPGLLSMSKVDNLLHRLRRVFPRMPLSYKTLLATNYDFDFRELDSGGVLWYKGVKTNLSELDLQEYLQKHNKITLDINMDGVPISKSPPKKFFPILGHLVETSNDPFIIAVFFGANDPNVHEFLTPYVEELEELLPRGFEFEGNYYPVVIRNYVLDAVARDQIKCIKAFNSYEGCEKCIVVGEWFSSRMTFVNLDAPLRTDLSFRLRQHPRHHSNDQAPSPLERIGTGMVSQFRLDSMHLLYLGVVKRLLDFWLHVPGPWKLHHEIVSILSEVFLFVKESCPHTDFNRMPNSFIFFKSFKATEFRRILLYDGILVFKDIVDENIYKHFLLLHCAGRIMNSPVHVQSKLELAKQLVRTFISHSVLIYGSMFVVYNVHSLLHLPTECEENGILEDFSAFKYENKLGTIKHTLRTGFKPLAQLARRDREKTSNGLLRVVLKSEPSHCILSKKHFIPNEIVQGQQYKKIVIGSVTFGLGIRNSCFKTKTGDVVVLKNIVRSGRSIYFVGQRFLMSENFYDYPIPSSDLDIESVSRLEERKRVYRLRNVLCKCWLMPNADHFLSVPILHSYF